MARIDDKTDIPMFAVLLALPTIVGGVVWLTSIDAKASASQDELQGVRKELVEIKSLMLESRDRLIRLEEHNKTKGR